MPTLNLIVVTPEATALDEETSFVALPLFDGEIGISPNHSPLIGRLGAGELRFRRDGQPVRYFVDGGFVQIDDNVVSVMTNRAVPATGLNSDEAAELLAKTLKQRAHSEERIVAREKTIQRVRAELRVSQKG